MGKVIPALVFLFLFSLITQAQDRCFKKGTLLISVTGGDTYGTFATRQKGNTENKGKSEKMDGIRDPLVVEYGFTDKIGAGFSLGGDYYSVDPRAFYGYPTWKDKIKIETSEITADLHYHFLTTKRLDFTMYGSVGIFGATFTDKSMGPKYTYASTGAIARAGAQMRIYVYKNCAISFMFSSFTSSASPKMASEGNFAKNVNTNIRGYATEFGICYRVPSHLY